MITFSSQEKNNNFGFLRFFFAVLVIFGHSYPLLGGPAHDDWLMHATHGEVFTGAVAVDGFFVISGLLVTQSWIRSRGSWHYLKNRCLRIFPGLAGALLFCVLIVGPLSNASHPQFISHFVHGYFLNSATWAFMKMLFLHETISGLPGAFLNNPMPFVVDGSLWTIKYEFACYLLVLCLGAVGVLRAPVVCLLLVAMLGLRHFIGDSLHPVPWYGSLTDAPRFVTFFVAGMTFALWQDRVPRSWMLALACVFGLMIANHFTRLSVVLPIFGSYLLFYAAFTKSPYLHRFGTRNDLSYGIYLYAFPVQQLLIQYLGAFLTPISLFFLTLPFVFGLAALSWKFIEQPALRWKSRSIRREADMTASPIDPVAEDFSLFTTK